MLVMKQYNFTRFEGGYQKGDNKIAINRSGLIRLSAGFCRTTNVKDFKYAALFYDPTNKAIAFKFTNGQEKGILKLTRDKSSLTISGKLFFLANNLEEKNCLGRYAYEKLFLPETGEIYVIELTKK